MANNKPTYQIPNSEKNAVQKRKKKQSTENKNYSLNQGITNQWDFQKDLHIIGIYDHEWNALHNSITEIRNECSKFNLGPFLDGFGSAISLPLMINFFKIISLKGNVSDEIIIESYLYGGCLLLYLISLTARKIFKPSWLTSYTRFDSDIKHIDDRMNEIETRIGISKKEE